VAITSPAPWSYFDEGDTVEIGVDASDDDGTVAAVWFYVDGLPLGIDSSAPFAWEWDTRRSAIETHLITAAAIDDQGTESRSWINVVLRWAYHVPEHLGDGWNVSSLSSEAIDASDIRSMMGLVHNEMTEYLHSIVIVRNGKLVLEEYLDNYSHDSLNHLQSSTKSITSALIGIAFDRGVIDDLQTPLFDFFPEYAHFRTPAKDQITLEHVLTMTVGLEWNEVSVPTLDMQNDNIAAHYAPSYVEYVLAKPAVLPAGSQWYYNGGCTVLLGAILRKVTGVHADVFAQDNLFGPLRIADAEWTYFNDGQPHTHGGLYLRSRDMAKIGQLFLQGGRWGAEQIVSETWVSESTRPHATVAGDIRYGYQWWMEPMHGHNVFYSSGYGGQHIFVLPAADLIAVTTAGYGNAEAVGAQADAVHRLMSNHIVPAVEFSGVVSQRY
jgi:CubicO group peptidase (beta-lactamase class C family)